MVAPLWPQRFGGIDQPIDLGAGQVLPGPIDRVRFSSRHSDCSIYSGWCHQFQRCFCHDFQCPGEADCPYITLFTNSKNLVDQSDSALFLKSVRVRDQPETRSSRPGRRGRTEPVNSEAVARKEYGKGRRGHAALSFISRRMVFSSIPISAPRMRHSLPFLPLSWHDV